MPNLAVGTPSDTISSASAQPPDIVGNSTQVLSQHVVRCLLLVDGLTPYSQTHRKKLKKLHCSVFILAPSPDHSTVKFRAALVTGPAGSHAVSSLGFAHSESPFAFAP